MKEDVTGSLQFKIIVLDSRFHRNETPDLGGEGGEKRLSIPGHPTINIGRKPGMSMNESPVFPPYTACYGSNRCSKQQDKWDRFITQDNSLLHSKEIPFYKMPGLVKHRFPVQAASILR